MVVGDCIPDDFTGGIFELMSESTSGIIFLKSRRVPLDFDSASVREPATEIQPLEFAKILTACDQLNFASFH